ncbi:hypothetical protein RABR111495_02120 [Rahnella bruchi]
MLFPFWISPRFFNTRSARWLCFRNNSDRLEILPLRGAFISGLQPQVCNLSFSKLSECPHHLKFKNRRFSSFKKWIGVLKIQLNGAASRPLARRPREGSAKHLNLRHSPMCRNMSIVPAIARSEKARSPEARALPGLWSVWADAHGFEVELVLARQGNFHTFPKGVIHPSHSPFTLTSTIKSQRG